MATLAIASRLDRARLTEIANGLAIAVAVSMPWSTSATSILLAVWLIALIPTLDWSDLRRELTTAVSGLPVLLFLLGTVGMTWAGVSWGARWGGLDGFVKLLVIPLMMAHFRHSDRGHRVLVGFLMSCVALLIASFIVTIWPAILPRPVGNAGVPVKSYILQGLEFTMCAAVLYDFAAAQALMWHWESVAELAVLILAFLGDIVLSRLAGRRWSSSRRSWLFMVSETSVGKAFSALPWRYSSLPLLCGQPRPICVNA
jgi:O-antigen ligase